jgi:hypothetical protein
MKSNDPRRALKVRAADALKSFLGQVSTIRVDQITLEPYAIRGSCDLLATIDVLGHPHTLACSVTPYGRSRHARIAVEELRKQPALPATWMPLLIAPHLSPGMQTLCKENEIGFLDFDGNARLVMDEVFIVKRTMAPRKAHSHTAACA